MKRRLAILGAGGHGKVVADTAECAEWNEIVFFDDAWPAITFNGIWPIIGDLAALMNSFHTFDGVIVAIGNNRIRYAKFMELMAKNAPLTSIIHPSAVISQYAQIGIGSVLFAGTVVNAEAKIGTAAILNTSSTVDHDCVLGHAVHLSPGVNLGGNVQIGNLSWIGIGACVRHGIHIGNQVMVGAGAAIVANIPDGITVGGIPAKPITNR